MIISQLNSLHREIKVWYSTSYILIESLNWYPQTSWTQFSSEFTSTISKISRLCLDFFDFSQFCHSVCHKITFCDKILSHLTEKVTETAVLWNVYGVLTRISSDYKMVLPLTLIWNRLLSWWILLMMCNTYQKSKLNICLQ